MADRKKVIREFRNWCEAMADECPIICIHVLDLLEEQEAEIERLKRPDCEHATHDGAGCLGYCGCEQDDDPIDACKQCEKYTGNICAEY